MPTLTRYWIKAGFINFVSALILAVLIPLSSVIEMPSFMPAMLPVYFHVFLVGWITQIIMGVSFWMFPPMSRVNPRGAEILGWASFFCINTGLILRVIGEPLLFLDPVSAGKWMLIVSALLQWVGGILYLVHIWERVKGKQVPSTGTIKIL